MKCELTNATNLATTLTTTGTRFRILITVSMVLNDVLYTNQTECQKERSSAGTWWVHVLVQLPCENKSVSRGSDHSLSLCAGTHSGYCLVTDSKAGGTKTNGSEVRELRA